VIVLDYKDRRPLYEQITERFQMLIVRGVLPKDMQMPSVRSQAMQLSINPNTIQRAYSELERQGYIYTIKGRGSFVADIGGILNVRKEEWKERLVKLAEEGYSLGIGSNEMAEIIRNAMPGDMREEENKTIPEKGGIGCD
jgi:DNA-binding transcriptional regulator YhcF (GntR family)